MKKKNTKTGMKVNRREFVGGAAGAVAAGSIIGFPNIVQAADPLRTIGLGVSVINEIQAQAGKDIGIKVNGQALGYGALFGKTLNQNNEYDVSECYFDMFDAMLPSKVFQPIDTKRIKNWDKVSNLTKTGMLTPGSQIGDGDARSQSFGLTKTACRPRARRVIFQPCRPSTTPIRWVTTRKTPAARSTAGPNCSAPISRAASP